MVQYVVGFCTKNISDLYPVFMSIGSTQSTKEVYENEWEALLGSEAVVKQRKEITTSSVLMLQVKEFSAQNSLRFYFDDFKTYKLMFPRT